MKLRRCLLISAIFLLLWNQARAQNRFVFDSLASKMKLSVGDSLLRPGFISQGDSTKQKVEYQLDSVVARLNTTVDSLKSLDMPTDRYFKALDSTYREVRLKVSVKFHAADTAVAAGEKLSEIDSLLTVKTDFLDSLMLRFGQTSPGALEALKKKIDPALPVASTMASATVPVDGLAVPVIKTPDLNLPLNVDANLSLPKASDMDGTAEIKSAIDEVQAVEKYGRATSEILQAGALKDKEAVAADVEKRVKGQAENLDQVKTLKNENERVEGLKKKAGALDEAGTDPEALKERAKKEFVDHLAGKEDLVKKDMEDIAKKQLKYRDVADARFLPKRVPNKMKGKPFIERLILGLSFQVFNAQDVAADIAPFIGYRFSGRLSAGLSGYRRIAYIGKDDAVRTLDSYGVRLYNNFQVIKGISTHVEVERYKPESTGSIIQPMDKEQWATKINLGLFQRYNIGKRTYGHFLIMYDLMQLKQFPNSTGSSIRFGFDYQIKKRKKSNAF